MCDYSLMELPSRLANEHERLQVYHFPTGTKGLAPVGTTQRSLWQQIKDLFSTEAESLPCVVCIPPGAQLTIHDFTPAIQRQFGIKATEEVVFTQLHANEGYHRDAIRFTNGQTLTLQMLQPGQQVDVLQLSLSEEEENIPSILIREQYEYASRYLGRSIEATALRD